MNIITGILGPPSRSSTIVKRLLGLSRGGSSPTRISIRVHQLSVVRRSGHEVVSAITHEVKHGCRHGGIPSHRIQRSDSRRVDLSTEIVVIRQHGLIINLRGNAMGS